MSCEKVHLLNRKILDLTQWKIEQSQKLKEFHEAQKKLLNLDCKTQVMELSHLKNTKCLQINPIPMEDLENKENLDLSHSPCELVGWFQRNHLNEKMNPPICDAKQENNVRERKEFLKRGEGLARFRMTFDDYKNPPKIYRNRAMKNKKGVNKKIIEGLHCNEQAEKIKNAKCGEMTSKCREYEGLKKTNNFSVDIYVPSKKGTEKNLSLITSKNKEFTLPEVKKFAKDKCSGRIKIKRDTENFSREKHSEKKSNEDFTKGIDEIEDEKTKDEKELRVFEILEEKVNEGDSFCSSSSLIDKLLEESSVLSPQKKEGLENCQEPVLHQVAASSCISSQEKSLGEGGKKYCAEGARKKGNKLHVLKKEVERENFNRGDVTLLSESKMYTTEGSVTMGNINDSKERFGTVGNDRSVMSILDEELNELTIVSNSPCVTRKKSNENKSSEKKFGYSLKEAQREKDFDKKEIALKLQRKGLQDNVKQLISWECTPRKKFSKKLANKTKPKSKKIDNGKSSSKEQTEKVVLSSSLLRDRLEELEKEIIVFRKENSKMEKLQKECREERIKLSRERKDFEKRMQEEKEKFEAKMEEDRKKLQKDRNVFETYRKQTNNRTSRKEREEIGQLKKNLEKMTEDLATKEARWAASHARLRNQIRTLEKENIRLTTECEKLQKSISQRLSSTYTGTNFNAKIIRAINLELEKFKSTEPNSLRIECGKCYCRTSRSHATPRIERPSEEKSLRRINSAPNIKKFWKKEEKERDDREKKEPGNNIREALPPSSRMSGAAAESKTNGNQEREAPIIQSDPVSVENDSCDSFRCALSPGASNSTNRLESNLRKNEKKSDSRALMETEVGKTSFGDPKLKVKENNEKATGFYSLLDKKNIEVENDLSDESLENAIEKSNSYLGNGEMVHSNEFPHYFLDENGKYRSQTCAMRETLLEDGTKEIIFPNGNLKKVSSDGKLVRMIYYNGDIKETNRDEGSEKYYYCETRTWHTTYKDGMEVIEFSNGQTERRYPDGSSEISFPNGCVRYSDSFGKDEWRFLDGTVMKTNENGHKILLLANGQKEIQTKDFKQREYPDGTIKIIYSDGSQETRYSSGRVRLKDRDGNLIMDSGGIF